MKLGRKPMPLFIAVQKVPKLQKEIKTTSIDSLGIVLNVSFLKSRGCPFEQIVIQTGRFSLTRSMTNLRDTVLLHRVDGLLSIEYVHVQRTHNT